MRGNEAQRPTQQPLMGSMDAQIKAERVKAVLSQTPVAVLVSVINASLMVAVLGVGSFGYREVMWWAAALTIGGLRLGLWRAYSDDGAPSDNRRRWDTASVGAAAIAGLLWGGGAVWLWPDSETEQLFWVFVVGGMCAGAAALSYAHLPAVLAFIGPAGLPVGIQFALEGSSRGYAASAMILVFLTALAFTARRSSVLFGEYVRLRLNAARHAEDIDAANAQLRQEIEERRATEESLRQAQKMEALGQLTGGVAHDFNNLLTPIVGSLDMLQRNGVGSEREQRLIAGAMQSADRAKTLVQRLLAFARRQPLQTSAVDVAGLVTSMADLVASTSGPQIRVVVEAAENLPPAKADPHQLEMAVLNLGVNARDAMPDGGTLRIIAGFESVDAEHRSKLRPGEYIRLCVTDTGVGMDDATRKRAVEPFFSTKGVGQGTGLGLSMVHGLAAQLGGALTIESRPGAGTSVDLWLPVSAAPVQLAKLPVAAVLIPTLKGTALLVDDEELVRMSTADMLGDMGYTVVEASSAEEALRLLDGGLRPDLLVTDHLMPGMNGTELAQAVRSNRPGVQVLVISGYAESDGINANLPRLTKPFRSADLAAKLLKLANGD
jgi:signal transduction histidine kinase